MRVEQLLKLVKDWAEPTDEIILEIDGTEYEIQGFEVNEYYGQLILKGMELEYDDEPGPDEGPPEDDDADVCTLPEHTPSTKPPKVTEA